MIVSTYIEINDRKIGLGFPVYIVAELSANHNQKFEDAIELIQVAHKAGADAVKIQTYTPDTLTINCDNDYFKIKGTIWAGRVLYDLYNEAYTPWEWQPELKRITNELGLDFFSTPFDKTSVDFLENMNVPAYKIASFEIIDIPFVEYVASKGKPIIISTGMATPEEIEEALETAKSAGATQIALLKCTSAYPALPEEMNLKTIPDLSSKFGVPIGLSDHTLGIEVPIAAAALGACIIEKHLTLSRSINGPDSAFSLEPTEFENMVNAIRTTEKALGEVQYNITEKEIESRGFRRSLFSVKDIKKGELFTEANIRSIRPGNGLSPKYLQEVLGKRATREIQEGTPLSWDLITK